MVGIAALLGHASAVGGVAVLNNSGSLPNAARKRFVPSFLQRWQERRKALPSGAPSMTGAS